MVNFHALLGGKPQSRFAIKFAAVLGTILLNRLSDYSSKLDGPA